MILKFINKYIFFAGSMKKTPDLVKLFLLGLLLTLTAGSASGNNTKQTIRFAVLIGNNFGGPDLSSLRYAESDTEKIYNVLTHLGGLKKNNVVLLLGKKSNDVIDAFNEVKQKIIKLNESGNAYETILIVYYSGHAQDKALQLGNTPLKMQTVKDFLTDSKAHISIGFIDACHSGEITRFKGGSPGPSFLYNFDDKMAAKGQVLITSSSADEYAQESDDIKGSFFTHYLVSGLRGDADKSKDSRVTLGEIYNYTYHKTVMRTTGTRGGVQHPTYNYEISGKGNIVLTAIKNAHGTLVFPKSYKGNYVIYDENKDIIVAEINKKTGDLRKIALDKGNYKIKKRMKEHLLVSEINISDKDQYSFSEDNMEIVSYEDDRSKGLRYRSLPPAGIHLSARLGYQSFFDAPTKENFIHPTTLYGFELEFTNLLRHNLNLLIDSSVGTGQHNLNFDSEEIPIDFIQINTGLGISYQMKFGNLIINPGARFSGIYIRRNFNVKMQNSSFQDMFAISPGLSLGIGWQFGSVIFDITSRLHYLFYKVEEDRSLGFGEIFGAFKYMIY